MNEAVNYFEDKLKYEAEMAFVKGLVDRPDEKYFLLDVRGRRAYETGHIPGALNIPRLDIERHLDVLPKDKTIVIYCYHPYCYAASKAALVLAKFGYSVMEMPGGFEAWESRGNPVEKPDDAKSSL
jgi:rhodanese-related sulfurtransferase